MSKADLKPEYLIFPDEKRTIERYTKMSILELIDEIEGCFRWRNKLNLFLDTYDAIYILMGNLYPEKYGQVPSDEQSSTYLTSLFRTKRGKRYINDLKSVLCRERLSKIVEESSTGSYLQQVAYLSERIAEIKDSHPRLQPYFGRIRSNLEAVFILRVGVDKLCPDSN